MVTSGDLPDLSWFLYEGNGARKPSLSLHSHLDAPLSPEKVRLLGRPHRTSHYFLMFVEKGMVKYSVDLKEVTVSSGQVLFVQPRQIRVPPLSKGGAEYYKVTFDEECLSLLPTRYRFWLDPLGDQLVTLPSDACARVGRDFDNLRGTLRAEGENVALAIAYLNTLMTELEMAYFADAARRVPTRNLEPFLRFQDLVEKEFANQPSVSNSARALAMSETSLYAVVKDHAGISPKEYLNRRIALEAQRLLFYADLSVKELARSLGFEDENYFSRFFHRQTGRSVSQFVAEFEDLSRNSTDLSLTSMTKGR
jgi:AraC family transcriptional activator of pobA